MSKINLFLIKIRELRTDLKDLYIAWEIYLKREYFLIRQKYRFAFTGIFVFLFFLGVFFWLIKSTLYAQGSIAVESGIASFPFKATSSWLIGGSAFGLLSIALRRRYYIFKRAFDILVSLFGLIVFAPLFLIIAVLIKIDSPGPIFFRQDRVGKDGRAFTILKFRSMRQNAELETGPVWAQEDDPRITRMGNFLRKTHLDELPQFINVFLGQMSVIGPRPERREMISMISKEIPDFSNRLKVQPGITGLAQVRYNYGANIKDAARKLKYDLIYIKRMCWLVDIQILFWTLKRVFTGEGAR